MGFKVASRVASKVARLHFRDATLAVVPFFGCNFFPKVAFGMQLTFSGCNLGCNLQFLDATFFPKVAFWDATLVAGLHFKVASKEKGCILGCNFFRGLHFGCNLGTH